jgi:hypothetical protein
MNWCEIQELILRGAGSSSPEEDSIFLMGAFSKSGPYLDIHLLQPRQVSRNRAVGLPIGKTTASSGKRRENTVLARSILFFRTERESHLSYVEIQP